MPRRVLLPSLAAIFLLLASGPMILCTLADPAPRPAEQTYGVDGDMNRLREGTLLVDEPGEFHQVGDRLVFKLDRSEAELTVLENLTLERVALMLRDANERTLWTVSGQVTEYQSLNYVLLSRAVMRRRSDQSPAGAR